MPQKLIDLVRDLEVHAEEEKQQQARRDAVEERVRNLLHTTITNYRPGTNVAVGEYLIREESYGRFVVRPVQSISPATEVA